MEMDHATIAAAVAYLIILGVIFVAGGVWPVISFVATSALFTWIGHHDDSKHR